MTQLPPWVLKIQAIWLALGTFLTIVAFQGIQVPAFLPEWFSQETFDVLVQAGSALFTAFQVIRSIFVASPKSAVVSTLSNDRVKTFAVNPFKVAA